MLSVIEGNGLRFGQIPNEEQNNIYVKTSSALLQGISSALSIIDLK